MLERATTVARFLEFGVYELMRYVGIGDRLSSPDKFYEEPQHQIFAPLILMSLKGHSAYNGAI